MPMTENIYFITMPPQDDAITGSVEITSPAERQAMRDMLIRIIGIERGVISFIETDISEESITERAFYLDQGAEDADPLSPVPLLVQLREQGVAVDYYSPTSTAFKTVKQFLDLVLAKKISEHDYKLRISFDLAWLLRDQAREIATLPFYQAIDAVYGTLCTTLVEDIKARGFKETMVMTFQEIPYFNGHNKGLNIYHVRIPNHDELPITGVLPVSLEEVIEYQLGEQFCFRSQLAYR